MDSQVLCIHCAGVKIDPCEEGSKCYLCDGVGTISQTLKDEVVKKAEASDHPPVLSI